MGSIISSARESASAAASDCGADFDRFLPSPDGVCGGGCANSKFEEMLSRSGGLRQTLKSIPKIVVQSDDVRPADLMFAHFRFEFNRNATTDADAGTGPRPVVVVAAGGRSDSSTNTSTSSAATPMIGAGESKVLPPPPPPPLPQARSPYESLLGVEFLSRLKLQIETHFRANDRPPVPIATSGGSRSGGSAGAGAGAGAGTAINGEAAVAAAKVFLALKELVAATSDAGWGSVSLRTHTEVIDFYGAESTHLHFWIAPAASHAPQLTALAKPASAQESVLQTAYANACSCAHIQPPLHLVFKRMSRPALHSNRLPHARRLSARNLIYSLFILCEFFDSRAPVTLMQPRLRT